MYDGKLMEEQIRAFVEGCDCVLGIGAMLTDFSSGAFTAQIDRSKSINIMHHSVRVGSAVYNSIAMKDVLVALAKKLQRKQIQAPKVHGLGDPVGKPSGEITVEYLYPRWQCSDRSICSSPRPERPPWDSPSPRCRKDRRS